MSHTTLSKLSLAVSVALGSLSMANLTYAEEAEKAVEDKTMESIAVVGKSVSYANTASSDEMLKQQTSMTSVLAAIDNLPGVLITEGDTFGSDDWSTSISIRGFQVDLGQQQIGMTIDGIANGNSNYGGGAKANRFIDTENLGFAEVSQGTADIASRSNEALGGTINFTTIEPGPEEQFVTSVTLGEFDAHKFFVRYETGEIAPDTFAWFSVSTQQTSDWIDQVAENTREHFAAKVISSIDDIHLTAYASYDDAHEDNYQRVYSLEQFKQSPDTDRLNSEWTGIPAVDQNYRRGWSTLRENLFAYLQADYAGDNFEAKANLYYHKNEGRGDWVPPYVVNVRNDGDGQPHSEVQTGNTVYGGAILGQIFFVDSTGVQLAPSAGCSASDPSCYERSAIPVGSYRHTHYEKERVGINADFAWFTQINGDMENTLRGGIWYEDYQRDESRDWHKIVDSAVSFRFDHTPYWVQYDRGFPVETLMLYIEDELDMGLAKVRLGVKQFNVDVEKNDFFNSANDKSVSSDSDTLISAGFVAPIPLDGLEVFGGYSENFAAIKDVTLERDDADLRFIEPETAENIDLGLRYSSQNVSASLTYYAIEFDNRINFVSNETADGIDFLESSAGGYNNVGGVESTGFEASLTVQLSEYFSVYTSYTNNESEYTRTIGNDGVVYANAQDGFDKNKTNPNFGLVAIQGNSVIGVADQLGVISFDWQKGNYSAGLSTKFVSERTLNVFDNETVRVGDAQTQSVLSDAEVDSYIVSDFYLGATIDDLGSSVESIDIRFTINNIFDESYLGTIAPGAAWIGAPRTAAINFKAVF